MAGSRVMTSRGRALAALLLGVAAWRAAATTRIPQHMDKNLLNVIKYNLRRNNDDYIDRLTNDDVNAQPLASRTPARAERRPRAPSAAAPRASRRDLDTFDINDILGQNENNQNTSTEGSDPADGKSPSQAPVRSRPATPSPAARAPPAAPASRVALRKRFSPTKGRRPAGGKAGGKTGGKAGRSRSPPRADILDMAPAKGSRINAKREKGRLCQRHVLLPEGPKYDEWGAAYLLAHGGRRPFPGTRAPRLLLPACCNCCKKSALGCE